MSKALTPAEASDGLLRAVFPDMAGEQLEATVAISMRHGSSMEARAQQLEQTLRTMSPYMLPAMSDVRGLDKTIDVLNVTEMARFARTDVLINGIKLPPCNTDGGIRPTTFNRSQGCVVFHMQWPCHYSDEIRYQLQPLAAYARESERVELADPALTPSRQQQLLQVISQRPCLMCMLYSQQQMVIAGLISGQRLFFVQQVAVETTYERVVGTDTVHPSHVLHPSHNGLAYVPPTPNTLVTNGVSLPTLGTLLQLEVVHDGAAQFHVDVDCLRHEHSLRPMGADRLAQVRQALVTSLTRLFPDISAEDMQLLYATPLTQPGLVSQARGRRDFEQCWAHPQLPGVLAYPFASLSARALQWRIARLSDLCAHLESMLADGDDSSGGKPGWARALQGMRSIDLLLATDDDDTTNNNNNNCGVESGKSILLRVWRLACNLRDAYLFSNTVGGLVRGIDVSLERLEHVDVPQWRFQAYGDADAMARAYAQLQFSDLVAASPPLENTKLWSQHSQGVAALLLTHLRGGWAAALGLEAGGNDGGGLTWRQILGRHLPLVSPELCAVWQQWVLCLLSQTVSGATDTSAVATGLGLWAWRSILARITPDTPILANTAGEPLPASACARVLDRLGSLCCRYTLGQHDCTGTAPCPLAAVADFSRGGAVLLDNVCQNQRELPVWTDRLYQYAAAVSSGTLSELDRRQLALYYHVPVFERLYRASVEQQVAVVEQLCAVPPCAMVCLECGQATLQRAPDSRSLGPQPPIVGYGFASRKPRVSKVKELLTQLNATTKPSLWWQPYLLPPVEEADREELLAKRALAGVTAAHNRLVNPRVISDRDKGAAASLITGVDRETPGWGAIEVSGDGKPASNSKSPAGDRRLFLCRTPNGHSPETQCGDVGGLDLRYNLMGAIVKIGVEQMVACTKCANMTLLAQTSCLKNSHYTCISCLRAMLEMSALNSTVPTCSQT